MQLNNCMQYYEKQMLQPALSQQHSEQNTH